MNAILQYMQLPGRDAKSIGLYSKIVEDGFSSISPSPKCCYVILEDHESDGSGWTQLSMLWIIVSCDQETKHRIRSSVLGYELIVSSLLKTEPAVSQITESFATEAPFRPTVFKGEKWSPSSQGYRVTDLTQQDNEHLSTDQSDSDGSLSTIGEEDEVSTDEESILE